MSLESCTRVPVPERGGIGEQDGPAESQDPNSVQCSVHLPNKQNETKETIDDPMLFFEIVNPFYIEKSRVNIVFTFQQEAEEGDT